MFIGAWSVRRMEDPVIIGTLNTQDCSECFEVEGIKLSDLSGGVNLGFGAIQ